MSVISEFGGIAFTLFSSYTKGGRVEAALEITGRNTERFADVAIRQGASPREVHPDRRTYDSKDVVAIYKRETEANLILKNNSSNTAYNLKYPNQDQIFYYFGFNETFRSLQGNESMIIPVKFVQYHQSVDKAEAERLPDIPKETQDKILIIQYANERGLKMYTQFRVSLTGPDNKHRLGRP